MPKGLITFSQSGKREDLEIWAIRQGSWDEIRESAKDLLASLIVEGHKKAYVELEDKRVLRNTVMSKVRQLEKEEAKAEADEKASLPWLVLPPENQIPSCYGHHIETAPECPKCLAIDLCKVETRKREAAALQS